jgi:hypothetical protein
MYFDFYMKWVDKADKKNGRLECHISDNLDKAYAAFDGQSEHLDVGKVIMLFKSRVIFSQILLELYYNVYIQY